MTPAWLTPSAETVCGKAETIEPAASTEPGGGLIAVADWLSVVDKASVGISRYFARMPLPAAGYYTIPIDDARLAVDTVVYSGGISMGPLSVVGALVAPAWLPAAPDWDSKGTPIGAMPATSPGTAPTTILSVPLDLLHLPAGAHASPGPPLTLSIRISGQEPPPNWLTHLSTRASCTPGSGVNVLLESEAHTEIKGIRLLYHFAFPPLSVKPLVESGLDPGAPPPYLPGN